MSNKLLVFGGQFGSEGKGAVLAHYSDTFKYSYTVRGGGPQAGHTFYTPQHGKVVVRQVPVGTLFGAIGYLGPGAVVDPEVLVEEMERYGVKGRVFVHPNAFAVTPDDQAAEREMVGRGLIPGSTCEGTGNTRARKALRMGKPTMMAGPKPIDPSYPFVDTNLAIYNAILGEWHHHEGAVLIEGCQGFGLSNNHGHWPYVTSGDVTPASILSECGLPILPELFTLAVLRTYPIRVGGNSGPMGDETTFEALGVAQEITTVTKKPRRIAYFDADAVIKMDLICNPDGIALTFLDYLTPVVRGLSWEQALETPQVQLFLTTWPKSLVRKLMLLGSGPHLKDYVGPTNTEAILS